MTDGDVTDIDDLGRLGLADYVVAAGDVYRVEHNHHTDGGHLVEVDEIPDGYFDRWDPDAGGEADCVHEFETVDGTVERWGSAFTYVVEECRNCGGLRVDKREKIDREGSL